MPNPIISSIKLPSGNVYELADSFARAALAAGLKFNIAWDGNSEPVIANIPAGVVVTYNNVDYTGTKAASTAAPLTFYLVKEVNSVYSEYVSIITGGSGTELDPYVYSWEKLGDTSLDLTSLGDMAYKNLSQVVATASNGAYTPASTQKKLTTATIHGMTMAMGTGADAETLIFTQEDATAATGGVSATSESTNVGATIVESVDAGTFTQPSVSLGYSGS